MVVWIKVYLPLIISIFAVGIVIWEKVYPRHSLHAAVNQIVYLRIPGNNSSSLLRDMLVIDLTSNKPSESAQKILADNQPLESARKSKNKKDLYRALDIIAQQKHITYEPPNEIVKQFTNDPRYKIPIYIPLVITNSGNRTANISTITLVMRKKNGPTKEWLYWAVAELDEKLLLKRHKKLKDTERFTQSLGMVAIPPQSVLRIDPYFIPITQVMGKNVWPGNLEPGAYELIVKCFGPNDSLVLKTRPANTIIRDKFLMNSLRGNETIENFHAENHFIKALSSY